MKLSIPPGSFSAMRWPKWAAGSQLNLARLVFSSTKPLYFESGRSFEEIAEREPVQKGRFTNLLGEFRADVDVELYLRHRVVAVVSPAAPRCQACTSDGQLPLIEETIDYDNSITSNQRARLIDPKRRMRR